MAESDGDWRSITAAADTLTAEGDPLDRSTLSRYVKKHEAGLAVHRDGSRTLVEMARLRQHRQENVRLAFRPTVAMPAAAASTPSVVSATAAAPERGAASSAQARKTAAEASMKEMELAQRTGRLVPVSEISGAMEDAVSMMRNAFDRAIETEASSLSLRYGWDERMARAALKGFSRAGLDTFHREVLKRTEGEAIIDAAAAVDREGAETLQ